ncbi:MAG: hypothetical protein ACE5D8_06755 [Fidelibacterota bacterium]
MIRVCLFIKDFELGTRVADKLTYEMATIDFGENLESEIVKKADLTIVDCDQPEQGTVLFMSQLRHLNKHQLLTGFMKLPHKETIDKLTAAGCELILPQSSLLKNIPSLLKMVRKHVPD